MNFIDFFVSVLGTNGNYNFLYYIFGVIAGLICLDAVLRFIFGGINNLFGGGRR